MTPYIYIYPQGHINMNKKILIVIIILVAAVVIAFAIYTISPLFISNTVNEPLPTTAAVINKNTASQEYQKLPLYQGQLKVSGIEGAGAVTTTKKVWYILTDTDDKGNAMPWVLTGLQN
jgi:hypothetical protein